MPRHYGECARLAGSDSASRDHLVALAAAQHSLQRLVAADMCHCLRARALLEVPPVAPAHSDHEAGNEVAAAVGGLVFGPGRSGMLGQQATRSELPQTRTEGGAGDA